MINIQSIPFLILLLLTANTNAEQASDITVVELFTSQGCYSCPPADRLLAELDEEANTITLACHVGYWNYLGWKDTFSNPFCDHRQRVYQAQLIGNPGVYTPQMVINGRFAAVGSRERTVRQAINIMRRAPRLHRIELRKGASNELEINLPAIQSSTRYQLTLLGTAGEQTVAINRGENGGKTLDYHNPMTVIKSLGYWDGDKTTLRESLKKDAVDVKQWVVLAQQLPLGEIQAAGALIVNMD